MRGIGVIGVLFTGLCLWMSAPARGDLVDLTTQNATGSATAAIGGTFSVQEINPTGSQGTGVLQPFLRVQHEGSEQGFTTDATTGDLPNSIKQTYDMDLAWTKSINLSDVPIVDVNGIQYREFVLDINQINSGTSKFLSLNQVQIFQSAAVSAGGPSIADLFPTGLTAAGPGSAPVVAFDPTYTSEVFRMNDSGDPSFTEVKLNYDLNAGSGQGDMFLYVANSAFNPNSPFQNLIFYSQFGSQPGQWPTNDGFEEWAYREMTPPPVPEPSSLALLGLVGLCGVAVRRRRRKQQSESSSATPS